MNALFSVRSLRDDSVIKTNLHETEAYTNSILESSELSILCLFAQFSSKISYPCIHLELVYRPALIVLHDMVDLYYYLNGFVFVLGIVGVAQRDRYYLPLLPACTSQAAVKYEHVTFVL